MQKPSFAALLCVLMLLGGCVTPPSQPRFIEPTTTGDHEAAAKASDDCRTKGINVSAVDILICAVALQRNLLIYTTDPDFKNYSRVLLLKFYALAVRP